MSRLFASEMDDEKVDMLAWGILRKLKEGRENDSLRAVVLNLIYTFSNHLREFLSPDFEGEPVYQFEEEQDPDFSIYFNSFMDV